MRLKYCWQLSCQNRYLFAFLACLVQLNVFNEIRVSFLMVGHTGDNHDIIYLSGRTNQSFHKFKPALLLAGLLLALIFGALHQNRIILWKCTYSATTSETHALNTHMVTPMRTKSSYYHSYWFSLKPDFSPLNVLYSCQTDQNTLIIASYRIFKLQLIKCSWKMCQYSSFLPVNFPILPNLSLQGLCVTAIILLKCQL